MSEIESNETVRSKPGYFWKFDRKCISRKTYQEGRENNIRESVSKQQASQVALVVKRKKKNPPANVGDTRNVSSGPGSGKSPSPGVESGNPLQYSSPENSMHRGARQVTVQGLQRVRHD